MATKLMRSAGRFGARYGQSVRRRTADIEDKQRKKQVCIFCKGHAKRISKGIWECKKCGRKFAGHAYYLEQSNEAVYESKQPKVLKSSKTKKSGEK